MLEAVVIQITKVDFDQKLLLGKDRRKVDMEFHLAPETKIRQIYPRESIHPLQEFTKESLILEVGKQVLVTWKSDNKGQKLAVEITTY